jgi:hypothetical protein
MIAHNLYSQSLSGEEYSTKVKTVPEEDAYIVAAADLHT